MRVRFHGFFDGALAGVFFPVQYVGPGYFLLFRPHQRQFDLVLDVFDMHLAAGLQAPADGLHYLLGDPVHGVVDAGRAGGFIAFHGQERFGHRHTDFGGIESNKGAVAFNNLKGLGIGSRGFGQSGGRHRASPCVRVVNATFAFTGEKTVWPRTTRTFTDKKWGGHPLNISGPWGSVSSVANNPYLLTLKREGAVSIPGRSSDSGA